MLLQVLNVKFEIKIKFSSNVTGAKRRGNAVPTRSHPTTIGGGMGRAAWAKAHPFLFRRGWTPLLNFEFCLNKFK